MSTLATSIQYSTGDSIYKKQEKETKGTQMGKTQKYLFVDNMILFTENLKGS